MDFLRNPVRRASLAFGTGVDHLGRAITQTLLALPIGAYHLVCRVYNWLHHRLGGVYSTVKQRFGQTTVPDLRCISWTLQTSLDQPVRLSALNHFMAIPELTDLPPTIAADCFDIFFGCINIDRNKMVVIQGLEQLAEVSVRSLSRALYHLSVVDPTSSVLADLCQNWHRNIPPYPDFRGLPFFHATTKIHSLVKTHALAKPHALGYQYRDPNPIGWENYCPSAQEFIPFAKHMVDAAQVEYDQSHNTKTPRWILRFALHSLSLDPPPPTSVVADCLKIIAIDLGCDVSNIATFDERYIRQLYRIKLSDRELAHERSKSQTSSSTNSK
jgi:hypothetical protein